ncbi:unnamed protein product [[Candida] boidinii]|nr:unnamed protein product [[Candida] boidinii]
MDFDPLEFFTSAPVVVKADESDEVRDRSTKSDFQESTDLIWDSKSLEEKEEEDVILHLLDLPSIRNQPTYEILLLVLKSLAPDEYCNFGETDENNDEDTKKIDEESFVNWLNAKNITIEQFEKSKSYSNIYCPLLSNFKILPKLNKNFPKDVLINYLTSIISSDLNWIKGTDKKDEILKIASVRISENLGRTAIHDFTRKIKLKIDSDNSLDIKLFEPSLTSDNLGLKTWGSSLVLSQRILKDSNKYLYGSILELGSGTGLVGIAIGKIISLCGNNNFENIMMTDLPEIIDNLNKNIEINNVDKSKVKAEILDWCNPQSFLNKYPNQKYDTIILSDPIYSPHHPILVKDMLNLFIKDLDTSRVLLQIPIRSRFENESMGMMTLENKILYLNYL